ncbi:hypothetical protein V491_05708 [Pseudogymnoascus sp. VKM F-3775]|nr:hypothetical protein V491_05708 [Pseudogymnoascus sp. VKM F-3775]
MKQHDPIFVPYIGDRVYDGLGFAGYPARRVFDIDGLLKGDFKEASSDQVASFFQTWLYFGMMHEILGAVVKTADFVRTDEYGNKWLTTNKLPGVLHKVRLLVDREKTLPEYSHEYVERRNNCIAKCLRLALDIWEGFSALKERHSVPNPMSPEISIAIQILGITLQAGATEICGGAPGEDSYRDVPWEHVRHFRLTHNAFIEERMVSQGWCPAMIEHVRSQFHVVGLYYASLLGPPRRTLDHGNCSMDLKCCRAIKGFQVGEVTHVVDGCQCELVCVDKFKLADIIRENKIPVLRFSKQKGKPSFEAVSSTSEPGLEYTAMSHVWSDGWGNPENNSLRLCRIEKIVSMISASYTIPDFHVEPPQGKHYRATKHDDRVFFWMDTLCVPREPADIYEKASKSHPSPTLQALDPSLYLQLIEFSN